MCPKKQQKIFTNYVINDGSITITIRHEVTNCYLLQDWELTRCETLLPFMCQIQACPRGSRHCSNGQCVNEDYFCDGQNDCADGSDEIDCEECVKHMNQLNSGQVESPGYRGNGNGRYPQFANCKWTLEGPPGTNIVLQVIKNGTSETKK